MRISIPVSLCIASFSLVALAAVDGTNRSLNMKTVIHTVCVTETYSIASRSTTPLKSPNEIYQEQISISRTKAQTPTSTYTVVLTSKITIPTSTPQPSTFPTDYMAVVSHWYTKIGMRSLERDLKLESNAMDTVVVSNGTMVHKLNTGTFAQVLAPGDNNNFEHVFVGGWLCEKPSLPGLGGVCATQSEGWVYNGQTGHAEILTSNNYSKIGCAIYTGIWCCDLA
jgi:hypothetical protein